MVSQHIPNALYTLHVHWKRSLFLGNGLTINGTDPYRLLTVRTRSSSDAALVIPLGSFNNSTALSNASSKRWGGNTSLRTEASSRDTESVRPGLSRASWFSMISSDYLAVGGWHSIIPRDCC